jgi:hypothetical protein
LRAALTLRQALLLAIGLPLTSCAGRAEDLPHLANGSVEVREPSTPVPALGEPPAPRRGYIHDACVQAKVLEGGFEQCNNGLIHRPAAGQCPIKDLGPIKDLEKSGALASCELPGRACDEKPYGSCHQGQGGLYCEYGCVTDDDCGPGQICFCDPGDVTRPAGICLQTNCRTDAECGGLLCTDFVPNPGCGYKAFACQTAEDECTTSADCVGACTVPWPPQPGKAARSCSQTQCVVGRPFLIQGRARVAPLRSGETWSAGATPNAVELTPELRSALGEAFAQAARLEHASVAAFARFSLQLMSLGAPPELLVASARAQLDEVAHAQGCFALATRYWGEAVGPGPLVVQGALDSMDVESIVVTAIAEGCIGESVAALEAREALVRCQDPETTQLLTRIAADEAEHAALAWRFVAWALRMWPALRPSVERAFGFGVPPSSVAAVPERPHAPSAGVNPAALERWGVLGPERRAEVRALALEAVVSPAAQALFAASAGARSADANVGGRRERV